MNQAMQQLAGSFDPVWGGFGGAPKFPSTMSLDLMLRAYQRAPQDDAKTIVTTSLDAMASGGIYDHIGGGFSRYSVDEEWLVPHFEKMLYDQALLDPRVPPRATWCWARPRWKQVVEETVEYVLRELRHAVRRVLLGRGRRLPRRARSRPRRSLPHVDERRGPRKCWAPMPTSRWSGTSSPTSATSKDARSPRACATAVNCVRPADVESARRRLFEARSQRRRPLLDDKVLTEWNGLMLASLAEAAGALDRADWLDAAVANGKFLVDNLRGDDDRWYRSWQADGEPQARHAALAADHAAIVDGFTRLAEATGDASVARACVALRPTRCSIISGTSTTAGCSRSPTMASSWSPARRISWTTPSRRRTRSPRWHWFGLAALTGEARYANHAEQILRLLGKVIPQAPTAFSNALAAVDMVATGTTEIAVVGDRPDLVRAVQSRWLPNAVLAWGTPYDSPLWEQRSEGFAYVCQHYVCQIPADSVETLLAQLA